MARPTHPERRPSPPAPPDSTFPPGRARGFTLIEILLVLTLLGLLIGFGAAPLWRMRTQAGLQTARAQVTAALTLARATSARVGRTSVLAIDTSAGRLRVQVDTSDIGASAPPVVVRDFFVSDETGVRVGSDRSALCFDARGVGVTTSVCPRVGALITLDAGDRSDTIRVNAAGRVW